MVTICYHKVYKEVIAINTFGERLKKYRLQAGLTQEELAARCGMQKQSISRYEKSAREPNIRIASSLAKALNISLETLINNFDIQNSAEEPEDDFPEVRMIARGAKKMNREDREKMLALIKIAFPDKFE